MTELCWDAEMNRTREGTRVTDCGFTAHPSLLKFPEDVEKVRLPYSVAAAEIDGQMSGEFCIACDEYGVSLNLKPADNSRGGIAENAKQTEEILNAKNKKREVEGVEHEFVMYKGVNHGFAVR